MSGEEWRDRIAFDPAVCHGKACIKGTRIMASVILDNLRSPNRVEDVLREYPGITEADVSAVLGYAAWLAREEEEHPLHGEPSE